MQSEEMYREENHVVACREKTVTVRNFTPNYSSGHKEQVKKEISETLYRVFYKYGKTQEN